MNDILCLYYSHTGTTRAVMEQIAELLEAELVEITDGKARKGAIGFIASGLDAMKKTPEELLPFETAKPLNAYEHVILATPVWAGRCSSIARSFLVAHGRELPEKVSYVITHMGDSPYEKVFGQMDQYLSAPHAFGLSLQPKADDYHRKVYDFARMIRGENGQEV